MQVNLFPFEKIEKNSRIIIYGFGDAGRQYLHQVKKTNWCEILFYVDRNFENLENIYVKVYSPEKISETDMELYDAILISVNDDIIANEISLSLVEMGVKKEKIVCATGREIRNGDRLDDCFGKEIIFQKPDKDYLKKYFNTSHLFDGHDRCLEKDYCAYLDALKYYNEEDRVFFTKSAAEAVDELKIPEISLFVYSRIDPSRIIDNPPYAIEYLRAVWSERRKNCRNGIQYCAEIAEWLGKQEKTEKERNFSKMMDLIKSIRSELSCEVLIIVLRMLFELKLFSKQCINLYIELLFEMEWKDDTPYGLVLDMAHLAFEVNGLDLVDNNYYSNQRILYRKISDYYKLSESLKTGKRKDIKNKRVAILSHEMHDSLIDVCPKITAMYANELVRNGYIVKIFVVGGFLLNEENCYLYKLYSMTKDVYENFDRYKNGLDPNVGVEFSKNEGVGERLKDTIRRICDFEPKFILDMSDEMSVETFSLYEKFPIMYIPFRTAGTCMVFDAYISQDRQITILQNRVFKSIQVNKIYEIKRMVLTPNTNNARYERKNFGFDSDDFLIVTVGHRLEYEIDDLLIEKMCEAMLDQSKFRWLLVGSAPKSNNIKYNELIKERVIIDWGEEKNITALYKMCDVYLQPRRVGGANGIRLAMREGLPIVLTDYLSDISYCYRGEETVCSNYEKIIECIKRLYHDKVFYNRQSNRSKEIISEKSFEKGIKKLADFCEKISEKNIKI